MKRVLTWQAGIALPLNIERHSASSNGFSYSICKNNGAWSAVGIRNSERKSIGDFDGDESGLMLAKDACQKHADEVSVELGGGDTEWLSPLQIEAEIHAVENRLEWKATMRGRQICDLAENTSELSSAELQQIRDLCSGADDDAYLAIADRLRERLISFGFFDEKYPRSRVDVAQLVATLEQKIVRLSSYGEQMDLIFDSLRLVCVVDHRALSCLWGVITNGGKEM